MLRISSNILSLILNLFEPEKIQKINKRRSKYLVSINPSYYDQKDESKILKVQTKDISNQYKFNNAEPEAETEHIYYAEKKIKNTNEDEYSENESYYHKKDNSNKSNSAVSKEKDITSNHTGNDNKTVQDKPKTMQDFKDMQSQKRLAEIKTTLTECCDIYSQNKEIVDLKDFDTIFDNIIENFIEPEITEVFNTIIKTDYQVAKNLIQITSRHSAIASILLNCFFIISKVDKPN